MMSIFAFENECWPKEMPHTQEEERNKKEEGRNVPPILDFARCKCCTCSGLVNGY